MFNRIAIAAVLSLYGAFGALAATTPLANTPELSTPAAQCSNGPSWEEGRLSFEESAAGLLTYVGSVENPDKTITVAYRDDTDANNFFILMFDTKHCFIVSFYADAATVRDEIGIIVATE